MLKKEEASSLADIHGEGYGVLLEKKDIWKGIFHECFPLKLSGMLRAMVARKKYTR